MPGSISNAAAQNIDLYILRGKTILSGTGGRAGVGAQSIYTITANKTFYVVQAGLTIHSTQDAATGLMSTSLAGVPVFLRLISQSASDKDSITVAYPHPIPITAGGGGATINVTSDHANLNVYGWVIGWEE